MPQRFAGGCLVLHTDRAGRCAEVDRPAAPCPVPCHRKEPGGRRSTPRWPVHHLTVRRHRDRRALPRPRKERLPRGGVRPQPWWLMFVVLMLGNYVAAQLFFPEPAAITIPYTFFKQQVAAGNVADVTSVGESIQGTFKAKTAYPPQGAEAAARRARPKPRASTQFRTQRPAFADQDLERRLDEKGVVIKAVDENASSWFKLVVGFGPTLLLIARVRLAQPPRGGGRRRRAVQPRAQPRQALQRGAAEGHLRRCRGDRRGRERADRDRRLPEEPRQVPAARRNRAEGRPARRRAGDRQDAAGARHRRPGGRSLLQPQRLRVHRDDRRRRRRPRPRPVQAGARGGARDHLHRRAGCDRPHARQRRATRRPRRARADAEPDPDRDGRLRFARGRHRPRRHQPRRHPRPGAAAAGALRPPSRRAAPRPRGPRRDPRGAHQERAPRAGRLPRTHRRRDARPGRGRTPQPGQRGRAARGAQGRQHRRRRGFRGGAPEDYPRPGSPHPAQPFRPRAHCLPRGGTRVARAVAAGQRPGSPRLDRAARHGARGDVAVPRSTIGPATRRTTCRRASPARWAAGRPRSSCTACPRPGPRATCSR